MRVLLIALFTVFLGLLLWHGVQTGSAIRACTLKYQDDLTTLRFQSAQVKGDNGNYCQLSYTLISSWQDCVTQAKATDPLPHLISVQLRPIVLAVLSASGEQSLHLSDIKTEHDGECGGHTETMFNPPPPIERSN